jgi:FkbM family methyltransferase
MKRIIASCFRMIGLEVSMIKTRSKKTNKLSFYHTETGNYYLPSDASGDDVANAIIDNQIFEKEIVDIASKYIKPDSVVLDIGANFGQMSVLFSDMVGENGKVHSFEADSWVYEILNKNIKANNKTGKIIPHFGAVYNIDDKSLIFPEQDFEEFGAYGSYGIDFNAKEGREVKTITIDSLNIEEPISFIKIDVQGCDLQAMQGAVSTIEKNKMPILFEYEYRFEDRFDICFQDYVDFVQSINYKFHKVINGQNFLIIPRTET